MQRWVVLTTIALPMLFAAIRPAAPRLVSWTTHALDKVRPYAEPPAQLKTSVELFAARNEFEPFQIVLRAGGNDIRDVDFEISDLAGPHGAIIPKSSTTIYFERFIDVVRRSSVEGQPGEWPDPLVPRADNYFHERRNAFPFTLKRERNQPVWIEIYVPLETPPGLYRGRVHVAVEGKREIDIPVELSVWNFTLPSTSSLTNTFGFAGIRALAGHFGKYTDDADLYRITHLYRKAALLHRISLHGGSMTPPNFTRDGDQVRIDWSLVDEEVGPFLDGTVLNPGEPLHGAKATSIDLRIHNGARTDEEKILYWREYAKHFREKDWFDRLFHYVIDEPMPEQYDDLIHLARLAHIADPGIKNLVTAPLDRAWSKEIDIWTPTVNCFFDKPGFNHYCRETVERSGYDRELSTGDKLWWYQACGSHGCYIVGGQYFRGWPSYVIDNTGMSNRIMQWMTWKYDISGELYFNINEAYGKESDPWRDVLRFGGNGDGTLVYPGRPQDIGGNSHIPIESIRLKLIREGLEDYEYLTLLTRAAGSETTRTFVNQLVENGFTFEKDPAKLYEIRRQIGEKLARITPYGRYTTSKD